MRIAVLDLETTGTKPYLGTIVEVGICMLDLKTGFTTPLLDTLVKEPQFENRFEGESLNESWIFQNTDLTPDMVRIAPTWKSIKRKSQKILNKFPVTAYNTAFDFGFLRSRGIT